jgi:uncharacterized protein (TIGR02466 family)
VGEPRTIKLFTTPVMAESWAGAQQYNAELQRVIMAHEAGSKGVVKSNLQGWQSEIDMLDWGGEAANRLAAHVVQRCNELTTDIAASGQRRFRWSPEMWANISRRGASNMAHCHPGAFWSAVYYVDDGYRGSSDKALGGELLLIDPRFPMVRMRTPDLRYFASEKNYDNQEVTMRPRTGMLVMFPSWLTHAVMPYLGDGTRISIAINIVVRPAQPTGAGNG